MYLDIQRQDQEGGEMKASSLSSAEIEKCVTVCSEEEQLTIEKKFSKSIFFILNLLIKVITLIVYRKAVWEKSSVIR